ncbi:MAG: hypothetical protein H6684_05730 [Deltaproteobacteria bacterium]|nr:hypothetical protein [bacterium]MCB9477970.1 hypothetical protein [Deltaproteobacteria bacterium]MCB9488211.1 hypothetical protein [Deltaproteobacteria bacterium]
MPGKILVIENSAELGHKLADFLVEMGYEARICNDSREALNFAFTYRPHLIIANAKTDKLSGPQLFRLFKAEREFRKTPFVMLDHRTREQLDLIKKKKDMPLGDDVICRPFDQSDVYAVVAKWLETGEEPKTFYKNPPANPLDDSRIAPESTVAPTAAASASAKTADGDASKDGKGSGNRITTINLTKLFYMLSQQKASGQIRAVHERKKIGVLIGNGIILDVKSNYIREDSLGRYLVSLGRITEKENRRSIERAEMKKQKQGVALRDMGLIGRPELYEALAAQRLRKLCSLFDAKWIDGEFEFKGHAVDTRENHPLNLPIVEFLFGPLMGTLDHNLAYKAFAKNNHHTKQIVMDPDFDKMAPKLGLNDHHLEIIRVIKNRTLEEILEGSVLNFDLKELVRLTFLLAVVKALSFK